MYNESDHTYNYTQPSDSTPNVYRVNGSENDVPPYRPPVSEPYFSGNTEQPRQYEPQPPKKKKGWTAGRVIALALCCSLLGGALGAGGVLLGSHLSDRNTPSSNGSANGNVSHMLEGLRENAVIDITKIETGKLLTAAEVYAQNVNSTVGITTSITTNFWGYQTTSAASGSGFILSDDGYILTNFHVVEDSSTITVSLYDGTTYDATLIGYDKSNDIAVLKVDGKDLTPVILGDSDNLNVGDGVVAIGNPLGELTFSLRCHQRNGSSNHHVYRRDHESDADRLCYQFRQLRRRAV